MEATDYEKTTTLYLKKIIKRLGKEKAVDIVLKSFHGGLTAKSKEVKDLLGVISKNKCY